MRVWLLVTFCNAEQIFLLMMDAHGHEKNYTFPEDKNTPEVLKLVTVTGLI